MEIERRNRWIGIIIGACFIITGPFFGYFRLSIVIYSIIFSILGGFIAGIFSQGDVKDGIKSGAISGFFGGVIFVIVIVRGVMISLPRGPADFIAGMAILFIPVIIAESVLFASAGGGVGAICKKALFGSGKQGRQQPSG